MSAESPSSVIKPDGAGGVILGKTAMVLLHSGKDLKVGDLNGFSDPYVRIRTNRCAELEGPVVWKTLNPVWQHLFCLPQFFPGDTITFDVWDRDLVGKDDFLGRAIIETSKDQPLTNLNNVSLVLKSRDRVKHGKVKKDKGIKGSILVSVSFNDMMAMPSPAHANRHSMSALDPAPLVITTSHQLRLTLHCGRGLKASDWDGKSDPYVKIKSRTIDITSPIIRKTLNPVWEYHIDVPSFCPGDSVHFEVWDHDDVSHDDFLGQADVYFSRRRTLDDRHHLILSLLPRSNEDTSISGNIEVSFRFGPAESGDGVPCQPCMDAAVPPPLTSGSSSSMVFPPVPASCSQSTNLSVTALPERLVRVSGFNNDAIDYPKLPDFEKHGINYGVSIPNFRDIGGWPIRHRDVHTGLVRTGHMKTHTVFRTSAVMRATELDAHRMMHELGIHHLFDLRTPDVAGNRGPYLTKFFAVQEPATSPDQLDTSWRASKQKIHPVNAFDTQQTLLKSDRQRSVLDSETGAALEAYKKLETVVFDWEAETAQFGEGGAIEWGKLFLHCLIGSKFRKHIIAKAKKTRLISAGLAKTPAAQKRAICGPIFDHPDGLEILYRMIVDDCQAEICTLFHHFLEESIFPVAFFCNHGKDRTGLTAAFLQLICGVSRETVIDGYQLSDYFLRPISVVVDQEMEDAGMNPTIMSRTPAWVLTNTLGYIDRHYGGVPQFLATCGFSLEKQEVLRNKLVNFDPPLDEAGINQAQETLLATRAQSVTITVHCAAQLKAADLNGFSDPFVVISLINTIPRKGANKPKIIGQTPIIWTSLDPVWEYSVTCGPIDAAASFLFDVWDYDGVKSNDFLGCARFFLDDQQPFTPITNLKLDLLPRTRSDKYVHGYITVSFSFQV